MDWTDNTILQALQLLTPGFISAWVLFALTADREYSDLQRVIQALIFSVFVKLLVGALAWFFAVCSAWIVFGEWTEKTEFSWSVLVGLFFGVVLSWLLNTDKLYGVLRRFKITTQTSRPSVWYSCFFDNPETYVVLELSDGRRIYGWPAEWPSLPGKGHIKLVSAAWLDSEGSGGIVAEMPLGSFVLIDSSDVRWLEFQPKPNNLM